MASGGRGGGGKGRREGGGKEGRPPQSAPGETIPGRGKTGASGASRDTTKGKVSGLNLRGGGGRGREASARGDTRPAQASRLLRPHPCCAPRQGGKRRA